MIFYQEIEEICLHYKDDRIYNKKLKLQVSRKSIYFMKNLHNFENIRGLHKVRQMKGLKLGILQQQRVGFLDVQEIKNANQSRNKLRTLSRKLPRYITYTVSDEFFIIISTLPDRYALATEGSGNRSLMIALKLKSAFEKKIQVYIRDYHRRCLQRYSNVNYNYIRSRIIL